jgi:hypothetical protein
MMQFSRYAISFLTDDIIRLRYVEIDGQLRKIIVVIKMRGGNHSKDIREYVITGKGLIILGPRQRWAEQPGDRRGSWLEFTDRETTCSRDLPQTRSHQPEPADCADALKKSGADTFSHCPFSS